MLEQQNKAILTDHSEARHDVHVDINFNPKLKEYVKMSIGGKEALIEIKEIYSLALFACTPDQRDDLMPVRQTEVYKFRKQHKVRVAKNITKGDMVVVNCEMDVPIAVYDGLRGLVKEEAKKIII